MPLPMSDQTGSNRWQLDSKTEKFLRCLLVEVSYQINEYLRPNLNILIPLHNDNIPLPFFR